MKRRSLLAMVPAASALLALRADGRPIVKTATTSKGFAISVQAWTFNRFTLWEAIDKAAEAGADCMELYPGQKLGGPHGETKMGPGLDAAVYASLLEQATKNKITFVNFGVCDIPADENQARATFEMAKTLGLYGLTTESAGSMDTLEKLAKEYDVKICFHNHPKGTAMWDTSKTWELIKDRHENIGFCCDVGHLATSDLDPLEVVKKIAPRIRSFHFKDRATKGVGVHDCPLGTGFINFPAILDEVLKLGFAGNTSIEYEHNWEKSVPEVSQCVGFLRGYAKTRA